eukprot:scaffold28957_cov112-Isochrysis_galbana.AAC.3
MRVSRILLLAAEEPALMNAQTKRSTAIIGIKPYKLKAVMPSRLPSILDLLTSSSFQKDRSRFGFSVMQRATSSACRAAA